MTINGYHLNGKYLDIISLLKDLMDKAILARTQKEAKTVLRLLRYLGITHLAYDVSTPGQLEMNIPYRGLKDHLYQVQIYNGELIATVTPMTMRKSALVVRPFMLVSDIISRKSLVATIRDIF